MIKSILISLVFFFCSSTVFAGTYYISPTGSNSANGLSEGAAWQTFVYAMVKLVAGDTLILLDGTYTEQLNVTVSGTSGSPVTFAAKNRGLAVIQPATDGSAIRVYSSPTSIKSYIAFDGFTARGKGEYPAIILDSQDNSTEAQMTHHITIRNSSAFGSGYSTEVHTWSIGRTRDSLVEDSWAYGLGRKSLQLYGCLRITVRRVVVRYDYWLGNKPNDPRVGFAAYNSKDGLYENIIVLDMAPDPAGVTSASKAGFAIEGNVTSTVLILGASGNGFYGILSLDNYGNGVYSSGISGGENNNNTIKDFIAWNNTSNELQLQTQSSYNTISYGTMGKSRLSGGIAFYNSSVTNNTISNSFITLNLLFGTNTGAGGANNTLINNSITNNGSGSTVEASYAPTLNYLVQPIMVTGHERGGTMVNRYVDGVLTSTPLWPWPNESLIRSQMCNSADLVTSHRVDANGTGWVPAWCASGKTLTDYVWGYLGNTVPPFNLIATPTSDTTVNLTWSPNTANANITGYKVYVGTSPGTFNFAGYAGGKNVGLATSETISGMTYGTLYYVTVTAVDSIKGVSGYLYETPVRTIPKPPTELTVVR